MDKGSQNKLPYALYRADQVRALDACAISDFGIPGSVLMERAGVACFAALRERWPDLRRLAILAGPGNNGGDGYVIARLARAHGFEPKLLQLGDHESLKGEAAEAAEAYAETGGKAESYRALPPSAELIIDAMLGTGLQRPLAGDYAKAVRELNAQRAPVLSVDIPTGLDADTGAMLGSAVRADLTLTFIALKQGLFTGQGPACCGELRFSGLEVPPGIYARQILSARRLDWHRLGSLVGRRSRSAHKGHFGHPLIIGGAPGLLGAARLAGEAALRAGAGLVSIATHPSHAALLNLHRPELMVRGVEDAGALALAAERCNLLVLGPGLGQGAWAKQLVESALGLPQLLVIDADGLNLIAGRGLKRENWILTPHPGEAARLLQIPVAEVEHDRFAAVAALQARYGGVVVLKGAGTLISSAGQRPIGVCSQGNPGMASGGMGDALSGIIGALAAQGHPLSDAAEIGVCLHAAAGDRAATDGEIGLLATDLIGALRATLQARFSPDHRQR